MNNLVYDPKEGLTRNALGMYGEHSGFGLIAKTNSTDVMDENYYQMNELNGKYIDLNNFKNKAKICKRIIHFDKVQRIVLEYINNELTTIIKEDDGLHYCETRKNIDLDNFYLTLTSKSLKDDSLFLEVVKVSFKTDVKHKLEYYKSEEIGTKYDSAELVSKIHDSVVEEHNKIQIYKKKFRAILTKKNIEIFNGIYDQDKETNSKLRQNIQTLDGVSQEIRQVLNYIHTNKESMSVKSSEYMSKIMNWLNSMADIYTGMEKEMDEIVNKLTSLKINE